MSFTYSDARVIDTLPPAERDELLAYQGFGGCACVCRLRVYPDRQGEPLIVLTELPENTGTSITNVAEHVYCLAWERLECPWPCRFLEHYPGEGANREPFDEHLSWVTFFRTDETPETRPYYSGGRVSGVQFAAAPEWRPGPLPLAFSALLPPATTAGDREVGHE